MGVAWAFEALHFPYINQVLSWTMYEASTVPSLNFQIGNVLHIVLAFIIWVMFYSVLSVTVLKRKGV